MFDIKVGSLLVANYGAMYPTIEMTVVDIDGYFVLAKEADGEEHTIHFDNIREYGSRSANGSPVGVFLQPTFH